MEIILATIVCLSVFLLGMLISLGNERQRRALDDLREQITHWAIQDLKLKREKMGWEIQKNDPGVWFRKMASRITGRDLQIQVSGIFDEPCALAFNSDDMLCKIVFSPISPGEIRKLGRKQKSRLSQGASQNPLFNIPRAAPYHELSALNSGILFDLELQAAWKDITGRELDSAERLWAYEIS